MRSRTVGSGRWILIASVFFSLASTDAAAQGTIKFVDPPDNVRRGVDYDQAVTVEWMISDTVPFRGPVRLTTTIGTVSTPMMMTDDFGRATFIVRSGTSGDATLTVELPDGTTEQRQLRFRDPPPADLEDLPPHNPPFGEFSVSRVDENEVRYWLAKDRIAARVEPGLRITEIQDFINDNFVIDRYLVGRTLMVFVFDETKRPKPLRELAEELEALEFMRGADLFKPIRKAGLFAKLDNSGQSFMVPDEIIVRFETLPPPADLAAFLDEFKDDYDLEELEQFTANTHRYLATVDTANQFKDAIQLATDMTRDSRVANADPNFATVIRPRSAGAGEPGFPLQWYHRNDGRYSTEDADIDTDRAWHFTEGSADTKITVIDSGFDIDHPDLQENIDAAKAVDIVDTDATDLLPENIGFSSYMHGTNAAGVAAARGDNNRGYSGSCPQCTLILVRQGHEPTGFESQQAIDTATIEEADVLSISWEIPNDDTAEETWETIQEAVDANVTVVMAMTNENLDNCVTQEDASYPDGSAHPAAIAVSGVTDYDERSPYAGQALGHGTCMDVLAPTRGGANGIHTTAVEIVEGESMSTYWDNFGGTSAATPLVAGVVGLIKTIDPDLSPLVVQRILQDTADRVDPAHADYSPVSGFSRPGGMPTHGYGRINAYEAVKLVATNAPSDVDVPRGNNKMDLFMRDNATDWGNTERPSDVRFNSPRERYNRFRSMDIKMDVNKDGPPVTTSGQFEEFAGETPQPNIDATVYVRIRNRGPETVSNATLKLYWAVADGTLPLLPDEFWTNYPTDTTDASTAWQLVDEVTLPDIPYSGSSIAGCPRTVPPCDPSGATVTDPAVIVPVELQSTPWDEDGGERLVLMAVVHHDDHDPVQGKLTGNSMFNVVQIAVTYDNNVTLWDPSNQGSGGGGIGLLMLLSLTLVALFARHSVEGRISLQSETCQSGIFRRP